MLARHLGAALAVALFAVALGRGSLGRRPVSVGAGKENFWPEFFAPDTLLLASLDKLTKVEVSRAGFVTLPLKIKKSVGSPCRTFLQLDSY